MDPWLNISFTVLPPPAHALPFPTPSSWETRWVPALKTHITVLGQALHTHRDQRCSHSQGEGLLGLTGRPVGCTWTSGQCQLPKRDPRAHV